MGRCNCRAARAQFVAAVQAKVKEIEDGCNRARVEHGQTVLGMDAVKAQRVTATPSKRHAMFGLRPKVACRSQWCRIEALQRNAHFV